MLFKDILHTYEDYPDTAVREDIAWLGARLKESVRALFALRAYAEERSVNRMVPLAEIHKQLGKILSVLAPFDDEG